MKKKMKAMAIILCMLMIISGFELTAFADNVATYEVGNKDELIAALNDSSDATDLVISLKDDISTDSSITFKKNTTLIGNGHVISFTRAGDYCHVNVSNGVTVNFGSPTDNTALTFKATGTSNGDGPGFVIIDENSKLYMYDGVTIKDFIGNNHFGGGVTLKSGIFHMYGGTIENCKVVGGSNCFGGGVGVVYGAQFIMDGGTINNCHVENSSAIGAFYYPHTAGGGVFVGNGGSFVMNGGSITNCSSLITAANKGSDAGLGGGVAVAASYTSYTNNGTIGYLDATFEMNGGTISGNTADFGGGIMALGTCTLSKPMAAYQPSMAANPEEDGFRINSGTISNNTAESGGGILTFYIMPSISEDGINARSYIKNVTITGNEATGDFGGGVFNYNSVTKLQISDCLISGNKAMAGAGIAAYDNGNGKTVLSNTIVKENIANDPSLDYGLGGGIMAMSESDFEFDNTCAIYDNTANVGGDDIYKDDSSVFTGLPTAAQMGTKANESFDGWYWDFENIDDTYAYPDEATTHPCQRFNKDTNAVAYTPIASEGAERYLKVVKASNWTVSFDLNYETTDVIAAQTVANGNVATEPTAPTRDGFNFGGWFTDKECTSPYNFATAITDDVTLYALWNPIWTVDFDLNYDSPNNPNSEKVDDGDNASQPTNPTRDGYDFGGWFLDPECTVQYDFTTPVSGNVKLYALWTPIVPDDPVDPDDSDDSDDSDDPDVPIVDPNDNGLTPDKPVHPNTGDSNTLDLLGFLFLASSLSALGLTIKSRKKN